MGKIAIYPGSFDPITNGHLDLINRGLKVFDEIIVAIAVNPIKQPLFTIEERVELIREVLNEHPRVKIDHFTGLLVDYVRQQGTNVILRGLRAVSDFDYEFQLALMNRRLAPEIETVFLMTSLKWVFLSSSILKEAVSLGGVVQDIVPPVVFQRLREKFGLE
ncbi:pantetheine-phosphate adenylyltransferase [Desulfobacca acetoxidans]|uniref:Phosphopantetheine adenylyltransferase n=1 Tax=Desulfobacca acetoxidans (strain ATCC 700848 / DSM 11109 / ASRB2) TaxID=880072 RepID=F2NE95_DESAR|nr:pantetheine-phosphate adenylyltransferase [Desulfobacca acetoxidans]AEB10725.1 Phosphopantetheine adenylyltransferase [Desulfobacca acetoxidans DSM 11109]HAY21830.1 pantetheine-phosphate adenylyltransferase [Desulfobacterales bacterium]